jgi:DNA-binding transcriptional regulator YhcF (GntR family)
VFDNRSPIYLQIAEQIKNDIVTGALAEDEQVMSMNQYASFYRINPATAAKGFAQLVDEGVLYKKRGIGMFVSWRASRSTSSRCRNARRCRSCRAARSRRSAWSAWVAARRTGMESPARTPGDRRTGGITAAGLQNDGEREVCDPRI